MLPAQNLEIISQKVEDDLATLSFVSKNGYYSVGEKNFNYKINALEHATRSRQPVVWEFNTQAFKNLNWRQSSGVSLDTLYHLRAQQLRNQYDYLVLSFSGGGDSYTVLRSFIDNNIHLDEIVCDWPISQTEKLKTSSDTSPENYHSEYELTIKPVLQYIQQHYPKIKITVTDSLEHLSMEDYEDTCTVTQIHNYVSIKRYRKIVSRIKTLSQKHSRIALILGTEKPLVQVQNNIFCAYFTDASCWIKSTVGAELLNIEYFYWSADMPEIVLEQAHVLYQHCKQNKNLIPYVINLQRGPFLSLIYPKWKSSTFQANKGTSSIYNEQYSWFFNQEKTIEIQSWESSMYSRLNMIDKKYLEYFPCGKFRGYINFFSRLYPIGKI